MQSDFQYDSNNPINHSWAKLFLQSIKVKGTHSGHLPRFNMDQHSGGLFYNLISLWNRAEHIYKKFRSGALTVKNGMHDWLGSPVDHNGKIFAICAHSQHARSGDKKSTHGRLFVKSILTLILFKTWNVPTDVRWTPCLPVRRTIILHQTVIVFPGQESVSQCQIWHFSRVDVHIMP